jgi:hypothetical protein
MKRVVCLAASVLLVTVAGVGAQVTYTYTISNGAEAGQFTVLQNTYAINSAKNVSIDSAVNVIRSLAYGSAVNIVFGAANGVLDVGESAIILKNESGSNKKWGAVTLTGAVKGSGVATTGVVRLVEETGATDFKVVCGAKVIGDFNRDAIETSGLVELKLAACDITTYYGRAVAAYGKKGSVEITEGAYIRVRGETAVYSEGYVRIDGGRIETSLSGVNSSGRPAVFLRGTFTITGGNIKTEAGTTLLAVGRGGEITGGTFVSVGSGSALDVAYGEVRVSEDASFKNNSATYAAVRLSGGDVRFEDRVEVTNDYLFGNAIEVSAAQSRVELGGAMRVRGALSSQFADAISVGGYFEPDSICELKLSGGILADGAVAVAGGGRYVSKFSIPNNIYYDIGKSGDNIVVSLKQGVKEGNYFLTGNVSAGYSATYGNETIASQTTLADALNNIKTSANGRSCNIYVGDGGTGLNIGLTPMTISGTGWGEVRLNGKLVSSNNYQYALVVSGGVSVVNRMVISGLGVQVKEGAYLSLNGEEGTSYGGILNQGGMVSMFSGKASHIDNDANGLLEIWGGTVGSDTLKGRAIINDTLARAVICGAAADVVSADTLRYSDGGTIVNNGVLKVTAGKVRNVRPYSNGFNYRSVAINNCNAGATVEISGTAEVFSTHKYSSLGVILNQYGKLTISGGKIYGTADTSGTLVSNSYGTLIISDSADIRSYSGSYIPVNCYFNGNTQDSVIKLMISGGTIAANRNYAVSTSGAGRAVITGNAKLTTGSSTGTVFIGPYVHLCLYGGTVSSNVADSNTAALAICNYEGGQGGAPGILEMGGTPVVNGIISINSIDVNGTRIKIATGSEYKFKPQSKPYRITTSKINDGNVIVENGAEFHSSFVWNDTAGKAGLKLAVNGDDIVACSNPYSVAFSVNGSTSGKAPDTIFVMRDGTIGEAAKPSTGGYISKDYFKNDGEWYVRNGGASNGNEVAGDLFTFGIKGAGGTPVSTNRVLTLYWTEERVISVLESSRDLPAARGSDVAAVVPVAAVSGGLTAGPSPVSGSASGAAVRFFRSGAPLGGGKLFIYDVAGNVVAKVSVSDDSGGLGRRSVAVWDLRDVSGRKVAVGTYVARGLITAKSGKTERVSVLVNVQR